MKNNFKLILVLSLFIVGCGGITNTTRGLDDEAFLEFVGDASKFKDGVQVVIDGKSSFNAIVFKDKTTRVKGSVYSIKKGKHEVSVTHQGKVIFKQQIFLSPQETRKVVLQ